MYNLQNIPITSACLNITDNCNFNCKYCFVNKKPNNMTFQVADDAIQWLISNSKEYEKIFGFKSPEISVFFFGGEPTLKWDDIIVPIVNKYPDINYSITTNGFLLNEEKINFLAKNDFSIMLSMDGNKITQNYNRKENSFPILDTMIPKLLTKISSVNFRGTIIPDTCENTFENILYAQNKGFHNCYFTINIFEEWSQEKRNILDNEIKKFAILYINSFINNSLIINFTPFTSMIKTIIKNEVGCISNQITIYKCGLGNGYGAIDYQGNIFTCQEAVTINNNDVFQIGNIYQGIDFHKKEQLTNSIVNSIEVTNNLNNDCINCPLQQNCKNNMCQVNNFLSNKNFLIQSENSCWWNQTLYKYAAWVISLLQDLPKFQDYMKTIFD